MPSTVQLAIVRDLPPPAVRLLLRKGAVPPGFARVVVRKSADMEWGYVVPSWAVLSALSAPCSIIVSDERHLSRVFHGDVCVTATWCGVRLCTAR
jgi:hypothetical protein